MYQNGRKRVRKKSKEESETRIRRRRDTGDGMKEEERKDGNTTKHLPFKQACQLEKLRPARTRSDFRDLQIVLYSQTLSFISRTLISNLRSWSGRSVTLNSHNRVNAGFLTPRGSNPTAFSAVKPWIKFTHSPNGTQFGSCLSPQQTLKHCKCQMRRLVSRACQRSSNQTHHRLSSCCYTHSDVQ